MALNFPSSPTPGQVYTDTVTKISWVWNNVLGAWESAQQPPVIVSASEPTTTIAGKMWLDSDTNVLKVYNGSEWVESISVIGTLYSNVQPTLRPDGSSLKDGDQWWDYDNNKLYVFDNGTWIIVTPDFGSPSVPPGSDASPGLPILGDIDTGLFSPGDNMLGFSTGGVGRFYITDDGVGIGGVPSSTFLVKDQLPSSFVDSIIENTSSSGRARLTLNVGLGGVNGQSVFSYIPDSELKIGVSANDPNSNLIFVNRNNTERMRLLSSGAVTFGSDWTSPIVSFQSGAPSNSLIVDTTGRVGIGSSPNFKLDVVSTSGTNIVRSYSSASTDARFLAQSTGSNTAFGSDSTGSYVIQNSALSFRTLTNNTERFRIHADGSIGFKGDGTTDAFFCVAGSKNGIIAHIRNAPNTNYDGVYLSASTPSGYNGALVVSPNTVPANGTSQYLTWFQSRTSGGTTLHDVKVDGKIIPSVGSTGGIHFPSDPFGGSGDTASITLQNAGGESQRMTFTINNDSDDVFSFVAPSSNGMLMNGNIVIHAANISSYAPSLTGSGASGTWNINVTGTSSYSSSSGTCSGNSATASLASSVVGIGGRVLYNSGNNSTTTSSNLTFDGTNLVCGGNITAFSDRRVKTDIRDIRNAVDIVNRMRGVFYKRIDDDTNRDNVGVIAQEVQGVLPEVVHDTGDYLSVSYGNIVAVLIEAIKEQQSTIDYLCERLESLEGHTDDTSF